MISKKQEKNYDNEVSTIDLSLVLFILSVCVITTNSIICLGTMIYKNHQYTHVNSINSVNSINAKNSINPIININKNLFTGIWYKIDSNYSNLHIYQNNKTNFKGEPNTGLINGYIDYKNNIIYTNSTSNNNIYNISYVHYVNNAYSFTILYDNAFKKYNVYRKYDYVVNIAFITKLVASLQQP
jgi:hypothetical protein